MMRYKAITSFTDMQDNGYAYNAGDTFPRIGLSVNEERIRELSTENNRRGKPVIVEVVAGVQKSTSEGVSDDTRVYIPSKEEKAHTEENTAQNKDAESGDVVVPAKRRRRGK